MKKAHPVSLRSPPLSTLRVEKGMQKNLNGIFMKGGYKKCELYCRIFLMMGEGAHPPPACPQGCALPRQWGTKDIL